MAYRVDRDIDNPKVLVSDNKVIGFQADDGFGINLSFVDSSHADYYIEKHGGRLTQFEIEDDFYDIIKTRRDKKKTGKKEYDKLVVTACTDPNVPNKENALYLAEGWFPYLKKNVKGKAQVMLDESDLVWAYWLDESEAEYEDGMEMSLKDAQESGFKYMTIAEAKRRELWHE